MDAVAYAIRNFLRQHPQRHMWAEEEEQQEDTSVDPDLAAEYAAQHEMEQEQAAREEAARAAYADVFSHPQDGPPDYLAMRADIQPEHMDTSRWPEWRYPNVNTITFDRIVTRLRNTHPSQLPEYLPLLAMALYGCRFHHLLKKPERAALLPAVRRALSNLFNYLTLARKKIYYQLAQVLADVIFYLPHPIGMIASVVG
jgi:hypothetical protein